MSFVRVESSRVHVPPRDGLDLGVGASMKAADFPDVSPQMKACRVRANLDDPRWRSDLRWNGGTAGRVNSWMEQRHFYLRMEAGDQCYHLPLPLSLLADDTGSALEDGIVFI
jgi:hypothetical protein